MKLIWRSPTWLCSVYVLIWVVYPLAKLVTLEDGTFYELIRYYKHCEGFVPAMVPTMIYVRTLTITFCKGRLLARRMTMVTGLERISHWQSDTACRTVVYNLLKYIFQQELQQNYKSLRILLSECKIVTRLIFNYKILIMISTQILEYREISITIWANYWDSIQIQSMYEDFGSITRILPEL